MDLRRWYVFPAGLFHFQAFADLGVDGYDHICALKVAMCLLVKSAPQNPLAAPALQEIDKAMELFKSVGDKSLVVEKAMVSPALGNRVICLPPEFRSDQLIITLLFHHALSIGISLRIRIYRGVWRASLLLHGCGTPAGAMALWTSVHIKSQTHSVA